MKATESMSRNKPCPCGSGEKYKKCCGFHKPSTATLGDLLTPETMRTLNSFMANKLKSTEPKETHACTRVDQTLDLRDASKPEINRLIEHLQKVEKWFNHYLGLKGLPLSVSTEAIQRTLRSGEQSEKYAFVQTWRKYNIQPGFIYESNVRNFVDILDHVLSNGRSINAIGGAQAGKTNFEVIWMLLGPAVLVLTNAAVLAGEAEKPLLYFPIITGPPHKNLGRQSQHAINNLFKMYGRMKFQTPNASMLSTSALSYFKQFLEMEPTYYEENTLERTRGEAEIDLPNKFVRRATQKSMDDLRTFIQDRVIYGLDAEGNARKERDLFRFEFLLIVDEAHHGAMDDEEKGNVSLFSKLMKSRLIYDDEEQTFANIVSDPDTLSRVILASATNWLAENEKLLETFEEVRLPLGDDYHGPNVFNCEYIDSSKQTTKPHYGGFSELADKAQQPFFKYFSPRAYDDVEAFRQVRDAMPCRCPHSQGDALALPHVQGCWSSMNHAEYRELSNKTLANIIRWMAIGSGDISGDMVIRFGNDNSSTNSIVSNVQPYLSDVDLRAWTGDKAGTAKEFILEHKKTSQKPVAVLVTGRARMGDDFPRSVRHYVEFAQKITTLNALDQGLCGRACGYNKFWREVPPNYKPEPGRPTRIKEGSTEIGVGNCVWLTDTETANALDHVASLANPLATGRKPHQAVKVEGFKKSHLKAFAGIGYALNDQKLNTWLDDVNNMVSHILRHDERDTQGKMLYRDEKDFAAVGAVEKNRTRYIPMFAKFDPTTYVRQSPELSRKIMGVDRLYIYGPNDVRSGNMKDVPYDLDPESGLVRASFEWDKRINSFVMQDNDPGKYGAKDTETIALIYSPRGSRANRGAGREGRGVKFRELMIKVVRVEANDHTKIVNEWRRQDHWKVAGVVFHCEKPELRDVTLRANINPHKGVTKQFGATAGGER